MTPRNSPNDEYVSTNFILQKTKRLSKRQLDYWATAGYVACFNPSPGPGRIRWYHRDEYPVIVHMDILVNQLGFAPDKAVEVALAAKENMTVTNHNGKGKYTWVENPETGVIVGLPMIEPI